jgi:hypothetical protein
MIKRYHWSYLEMEEHKDGLWVDGDDYDQLATVLDSKSMELDEVYRQTAYNGESYG